jgi:hypothetical protein
MADRKGSKNGTASDSTTNCNMIWIFDHKASLGDGDSVLDHKNNMRKF